MRHVFEALFYYTAMYNKENVLDELIDIYRRNINNSNIINNILPSVEHLYKNEDFVDKIHGLIMPNAVSYSCEYL